MTEFEKMISGQLYNAEVPELQAMRRRAAELCHRLEALSPAQEEDRSALLRELLGSVKGSCTINSGFHCDYGSNITVGDHFYANYNCVILDCAPVTFGDNVFIAPNCGFYTAGHPLDAPTRNRGLEFAKSITVGDDVWIGGSVAVLPGVTIGSGAVIGAGSVVTHDKPSGLPGQPPPPGPGRPDPGGSEPGQTP